MGYWATVRWPALRVAMLHTSGSSKSKASSSTKVRRVSDQLADQLFCTSTSNVRLSCFFKIKSSAAATLRLTRALADTPSVLVSLFFFVLLLVDGGKLCLTSSIVFS